MKVYKTLDNIEVKLSLRTNVLEKDLLQYISLKLEFFEDEELVEEIEDKIFYYVLTEVIDFDGRSEFVEEYFRRNDNGPVSSEEDLIRRVECLPNEIKINCHAFPLHLFGNDYAPKKIQDDYFGEFKKYLLFNNNIPLVDRLSVLSLDQLKTLAKKYAQKISGNKSQIIERLSELPEVTKDVDEMLKGSQVVMINKSVLPAEICDLVREYQTYVREKMERIYESATEYSSGDEEDKEEESKDLGKSNFITFFNSCFGRSFKKNESGTLRNKLRLNNNVSLFFDKDYNELALLSDIPLEDTKKDIFKLVPSDSITMEIMLHDEKTYILAFSLVNVGHTDDVLYEETDEET